MNPIFTLRGITSVLRKPIARQLRFSLPKNYILPIMAKQQTLAAFFSGVPKPKKEVASQQTLDSSVSTKRSNRADSGTETTEKRLKKDAAGTPGTAGSSETAETSESQTTATESQPTQEITADTDPEPSDPEAVPENDQEEKKKELNEAAELLAVPAIGQPETPTATEVSISRLDGSILSWSADEDVPYAALAATFEKIEATTKRLQIIAYTAAFFHTILRTAKPEALIPVTYLFINRLGPDYEGLELGLGESLLIKSIAEGTGRSTAQIKREYQQTGDLGTIAQKSRVTQPTMFKPKPLTVSVVFRDLKQIATTTGNSAQSRKISIINRLLTACNPLEAKYLVRSLEGKLRIGLAEKSVLLALSQAFLTWEAEKAAAKRGKKPKPVSPDEFVKGEEKIRDAYAQIPNYEMIIRALLQYGVSALSEKIKLTEGIPLKPMLAKPTKSITEVLDRFKSAKFTCEYKYDGERAQVHLLPDGNVKVYSRNGEDMSQRYPDIANSVPEFINSDHSEPVKSFILDAEAVAWDTAAQKILPFQVLSTRKRKDVNESEITVKVCLFAFDLLAYNSQSLLREPLDKRRAVLHQILHPVTNKFSFATVRDFDTTEADPTAINDMQTFLDDSVADACEGLMVKMLTGPESFYEPSKRSRNWLKLKKDYLEGVGDSLDLVVLGAYYGRGKRTSVYGGFLLGCYNPDSGCYETTCKIGTGFSEEKLIQFHEQLSKTVIDGPKSYYVYDPSAMPDVWFEATTVWEVLTADLSLSPTYKAGADVFGKGISLRFPRFVRVREDKGTEDATTSEQIIEFYNRQMSTAGAEADNDFSD